MLINPNSNRIFTDLMNGNVEHLRAGGACKIDCVTLTGTPAGIDTQRDIDSVVEPICKLVSTESAKVDAFVIGCFADTGLFSAREMTSKPVLGLCQAGLSTALNMGERFGVISTSTESRNADLRLVRSYGLLERCVGFEPVEIPVADIPTSAAAKGCVLEAASRLKALGADVLVLGCAGMAPYTSLLRETFKIPVVDPTVSAVAMAIGIVAMARQ
ncbi:aspartate/glutamate racemase family protein [Mesorhizobium abyssinicae]|uniref:Aspartate/glutamate racemase family protein n=1 Tax=Mesorhizobium abyssinicae TaxID=1209958 RepID=A0ABU5AX57_9HYPH|nr:aspartate/glutamate racemase family protein [Mesorhizobium abyssinicae]MDX8541888.1 aspartate/glutamate racemase family protein [Mesorhizobium abyssinicae]